MLRHIRLLILDLDYVVYDCAVLKVQALRHSMIALANVIPQGVRLPATTDAEEGYREHGCRWIRHLELGLDDERLDHLQKAYPLQENRLVESGAGRLYSGIDEFLARCRALDLTLALGADADRDYLVAVADRHQLDGLFQIALCTEEFGMGSADEMLEEIMRQAEVNPSETLVLGTRPHFFEAAHALDILTIGCGWGIHRHESLEGADLKAIHLTQLFAAIEKADYLNSQYTD